MAGPEEVVSADGTPIAVWRTGEGPPLVLVHGAAADHGRWAPVLPALQERFTVLAMDRRGRGGSGDAEDYEIEREYEDVAAVVEWAGDGVDLLGHSHGGACARRGGAAHRPGRQARALRGADGLHQVGAGRSSAGSRSCSPQASATSCSPCSSPRWPAFPRTRSR